MRKQKQLQEEGVMAAETRQRLNDLAMQIEICRKDKAERVERYQQDVQRMDQLIE